MGVKAVYAKIAAVRIFGKIIVESKKVAFALTIFLIWEKEFLAASTDCAIKEKDSS